MMHSYAPIQKHALIYIDDILLFSKNEEEHQQLSSQFLDITIQHGIMLSAKKMEIGVSKVNFLGVIITNGTYDLQLHIGKSLLEFSDGPFTIPQLQRFLGIVNYMIEFIPNQTRFLLMGSAFFKQMPAMTNGQQYCLKNFIMEPEKCVDTEVHSLNQLNAITIPLSKRYWQFAEGLKNSNFISLATPSRLKWTCHLSPECFNSSRRFSQNHNSSDGHNGSLNGHSRSNTSREKKMF
ncbi:uncharacterized protein LOC122655480 [Telopea speciosissima]|uniref:uncharacterized protein LOC122655480 n=1 Tax=Telopea speciosissima TaxID=54955 RepID=UPI001CC6E473|nr:uncharacterized protein LOC122655480 [Telopea speciosissima]